MTGRKKQISDAATELFLSEGVGVTTARIAAAAGVSNGTLFNVFPTKQALIDHIYTTSKAEMFAAMSAAIATPMDRAGLHRNWRNYLAWARQSGSARQVMHLLHESGLASDTAKADIEAAGGPILAWFAEAHEAGRIRGPSVAYCATLALYQLDLVLNHQIEGADEELAFDMLCHSIGLSK